MAALDRNRWPASIGMHGRLRRNPHKDLPCFQLGYAVPEKYRAQSRAKKIVTAAIAELQNGLSRNGIAGFCIEAVVGTDNEPSMRVASATISSSLYQ